MKKKSSGRYSEQQQLQIVAFWPGAIKQAGLDSIAGIVYRDPITGELVRTKERSLTNISEIPFFYKDMKDFANRIVYYESSRGCPFRCGYCLSSIDKRVRLRDLALVKEELQFFLDQKVPQVKFIDRTFNCNHQHAMEIWKYIQEHDNGITNFHFEISADLLNGEELALLAKKCAPVWFSWKSVCSPRICKPLKRSDGIQIWISCGMQWYGSIPNIIFMCTWI